jgi:hypothetical protein
MFLKMRLPTRLSMRRITSGSRPSQQLGERLLLPSDIFCLSWRLCDLAREAVKTDCLYDDPSAGGT